MAGFVLNEKPAERRLKQAQDGAIAIHALNACFCILLASRQGTWQRNIWDKWCRQVIMTIKSIPTLLKWFMKDKQSNLMWRAECLAIKFDHSK